MALNFTSGGARQLSGQRVSSRKLECRQLARELFARAAIAASPSALDVATM